MYGYNADIVYIIIIIKNIIQDNVILENKAE